MHGLGSAVIAVAVVWTVLQAVSTVASLDALDRYRAARQALTSWDTVVTVYDLLALPMLLVMIVAYLLTGLFLGQVRGNAVAVDPRSQERSAIWVWLSWWVPVVCWWFPYQVVRDLLEATVYGARGGRARRPRLGWWWAVWLIASLLAQLADQVATVTGGVTTAVVWFEALATVVLTIACVLWVRIVRTLVVVQDELVARAGYPVPR